MSANGNGIWPTMKETKADLVVGYADETRKMVEFLSALPEAEWSHSSLCPEWDIKGVASHLVGQAKDFLDRKHTGQIRKAAKQGADVVVPLMVATNQRHYADGRRYSNMELLALLQELRGRVAIRFTQIPKLMFKMTIKGMLPMRLHEALGIQIFESWVHRQDMMRAHGDIDSSGPFDLLLPSVFFGITRMRNYEPSSPINVDLGAEGVFSLSPGSGFARGPAAGAKATVAIDPAELVLIAAGRLDADDAKASIEGSEGAGKELLYSIRYTGLTPGL
ncbi:MAG: maleylpyruvate isomerase family mycothiol-dependent enzyme [Actinomycetota bacterium]